MASSSDPSKSLSDKAKEDESKHDASSTTDVKSAATADADELSKLLDSALDDFGKSTAKAAPEDVSGDSSSIPPVFQFDPELAQRAAAEFQTMLHNLIEIQKACQPPPTAAAAATPSVDAASGTGAPAELPPGFGDDADTAALGAFLQQMNLLAGQVQGVQEGVPSEADFMQSLASFAGPQEGGADTMNMFENEFLPFMQGLVGNLLSKEMLYPSLKDMCEKYPAWLAEHGATLPETERKRYEKQLELMRAACDEYESEKDDDSSECRDARFRHLIELMQQMQLCGHPPADLVGDLPPGWELDMNGLPKVVDNKAAAEACSIM